MRVIEIGDMGFFCHSLKEKSIVGIVQVIAKEHTEAPQMVHDGSA